MLNESIFCELVVSPLNTQLLYCKYCNRAVDATNYNQQELCPVLLAKHSEITSGIKLLHTQKITSLEELQRNLQVANMPRPQPPTDNICSQEQIDSRLDICKTCEFYENNSCLQCGCILSRDQNYMNKLYKANQSCPIGKWGPIVSGVSS